MNTEVPATVTPAQQTRSTRRIAAATAAATIAIVGICGAAVFAFAPSSHASTAPHQGTSSSSYQPGGSGSHGGSAVKPSPAKPSSSIKVLQQELGQLNYYEGPVDGIAGPQTTAAIKYLQRDAHLPQTGVMNQATTNAMIKMLVSGNNVMGAN